MNEQTSVVEAEVFAEHFDGYLPVWKPSGLVSKDVSRLLKRVLPRKQKIGHLGTLDPMAEGVLVVLFGYANKTMDLLNRVPKTYKVDFQFGFETDTLDSTGETTRVSEPVDQKKIAGALSESVLGFLGEIRQIPPLYSAVKHKGKPLYHYARKGSSASLDLKSFERLVRIHDISDVEVRGSNASFEVRCGSGLYVRSLVRDVAYSLGTLATMTGLTRTESAGFKRSDCIELNGQPTLSEVASKIMPVTRSRLGCSYVEVGCADIVKRLRQGQTVVLDTASSRQKHQFSLGLRSADDSVDCLVLSLPDSSVFGLGRVVVRRNDREYIVKATKIF